MTVPISSKEKLTPPTAMTPRLNETKALRARPARRTAVSPSGADMEAEAAAFELAPSSTDAGGATAKTPASLDAYLANFVKPSLSDPGVLKLSRSLPILEHILSEVVPKLEGGKELQALAAGVIEDEIARRRDLLMRIQQAIGG